MVGNLARGRNPLNPGGTGYTPPSNDIQHSEQVPLDQLKFDSGGFPIGQYGPPSARVALGYQYEAEKNAAQRQQGYFGDAQASLAQGAHMLESYRPGGATALRSGIYGQQSQLAYNIGSQTQAPDLLSDYRRDQGAQAQHAAAQASRNQLIGGVLQAGATILGGVVGGPPGAVAGAAAGGAASQGLGLTGQSMLGPGVGTSPSGPSGGGITPQAPSYAPGPIGAQPPGTSLPSPGGGGAAQSRLGPSGGGGPGSPSGGSPGPSGSPSQQGGGGGGMAGGGFGADGNFMPAALAAAGARQLGPMNDQIMVKLAAQEHDWAFWQAANDAADRQLELAIHSMMGG
jgi:hypothetical protein